MTYPSRKCLSASYCGGLAAPSPEDLSGLANGDAV